MKIITIRNLLVAALLVLLAIALPFGRWLELLPLGDGLTLCRKR